MAALVSTVDFFSPMVEDPFLFGKIAAANALSDIYAMGGKPLFALNLICFPEKLDRSILGEILAGGAATALEADTVIAGGHSIYDHEPKYGLAVTGIIDPRQFLR
jgi:selenide,water dikinase